MNQRWYDKYASMSLAINILQSTSIANREKVVKAIQTQIRTQYPAVTLIVESERRWLMKLFQKRRSLDASAWMMIENLKYLTDDQREEFAQKIVDLVNHLEEQTAYEETVTEFLKII